MIGVIGLNIIGLLFRVTVAVIRVGLRSLVSAWVRIGLLKQS